MTSFFGAHRSLPLALALIALLTAPSFAEDADGRDQMRMMGQCRGCIFDSIDLSGEKLMGVNLAQSELTSVDFEGAELDIAVFDFALLENVSFEGAHLR